MRPCNIIFRDEKKKKDVLICMLHALLLLEFQYSIQQKSPYAAVIPEYLLFRFSSMQHMWWTYARARVCVSALMVAECVWCLVKNRRVSKGNDRGRRLTAVLLGFKGHVKSCTSPR